MPVLIWTSKRKVLSELIILVKMPSKCCEVNGSPAEDCCCDPCGNSQKCFMKQVFGVCRADLPCMKKPKPQPASFVSICQFHEMNHFFGQIKDIHLMAERKWWKVIRIIHWCVLYAFFQLEMYKTHRNPMFPWIDWHYRPMITSASVLVNHYHHQLKRRTPAMPDIYYHDLPEDAHKYIWIS